MPLLLAVQAAIAPVTIAGSYAGPLSLQAIA